ncbi:MAG: alpha/beta hydrolase [Rikenellaceae bacterium]|nr:alpha/beta hydrolase [Rikenellaceae bacterium]
MVQEKFITAGGYATRIKCYGFDKQTDDRPVLLLLHGYLESLDVWDDFVPSLAGVRVITMDIPGHGISEIRGDIHTMEEMAGVVAGVADHTGVEKFWLAGHSMGGYVAAEFLARFPERLGGIIMFHSTPNPDSDAKKEQRSREIELVRAGKKDLLAATVEKGFAADNRRRFDDVIEDLKEQVVLTEDEGVIVLLRGMMQRRDHNETFRQSPVPQLFIMGNKDEYIPLEVSTALREEHPQAGFVYLPGSGHMGFVEEPDSSTDAILSFIGLP